MANKRKGAPMTKRNPEPSVTLESLIHQIWDKGQCAISHVNIPRRCLSEESHMIFGGEAVTHYDYVWRELGIRATLLLYQGKSRGEICFGAVSNKDIKLLGKIDFTWNRKTQKFKESDA